MLKYMKKDIYDFRDYKAYLKYWVAQKPGKGRGLQTQMANKIDCQTGYVSQVLNTGANFSLEQAEGINQFIGHTYEEGHFFILLVELSRAGTVDLKKRFQNEIDKILNQRLILKDRVDIKKSLEPVDQATYYSSWYFAAIHVAISIPSLQTREALMKYLGLSGETVNEALSFLTSVGLLDKKGDHYTQGVARLFLGKDSPMIKKHHTNWRMRAIHSLDVSLDKNLHFSTVVSLSQDDLLAIKEKLVKAIEDTRAIIRESKEEKVCCFSLDFFNLEA
jgi:uncharacterized protein (TIGR02147 family)